MKWSEFLRCSSFAILSISLFNPRPSRRLSFHFFFSFLSSSSPRERRSPLSKNSSPFPSFSPSRLIPAGCRRANKLSLVCICTSWTVTLLARFLIDFPITRIRGVLRTHSLRFPSFRVQPAFPSANKRFSIPLSHLPTLSVAPSFSHPPFFKHVRARPPRYVRVFFSARPRATADTSFPRARPNRDPNVLSNNRRCTYSRSADRNRRSSARFCCKWDTSRTRDLQFSIDR